MIELKNISKKYGNSSKYAVQPTDLSIKPGKIIGFIGHNGAGKSTTLKMMTGVLTPSTGDVIINGYSITNDDLKAKKEFGYVPDSPDVFLKLTGFEYLNFMGTAYGVEPSILKKRIDELANQYLMSDKLGDLIDSYSHGMRQKIVVMGALVHEPHIMILDEPLTGLDPQASRLLKDSMKDHVAKGHTVLFSTHVLEVAEKLCDEILVINKGKFIYQGTLEALKEQYSESTSLEDIFFAITSEND
ncbi:ABC-2 type transport system ATP-binding protein [Bacilli bacterium PM5-3]|nr:ABC-2 type transport system ATP-binding protein [Bacilli bacterium PM5-3]MDH6604052.1 ABC-2 type transport system ATP-binding protein [Bacilli bacterium PM5-9]